MADDDVQGGMERFRPGVLELISKLIKVNGGVADVLRCDDSTTPTKGNEIEGSKEKTLIVPVVEANESFL
jgi:hypothetical protein